MDEFDFRPGVALGEDSIIDSSEQDFDFRPSQVPSPSEVAQMQQPPVVDDGQSSQPDSSQQPPVGASTRSRVRRRGPVVQPNIVTDQDGFPIDLDRPLVLSGTDVLTEYQATIDGFELGLPVQPGQIFYNIPTVIDGRVENSLPAAIERTREKLNSGELSLDAIPRYSDPEVAAAAAAARSQQIGELRRDEIESFIEQAKADQRTQRIDQAFAEPGPTQEKTDILTNVQNPSYTQVKGTPGNFTLPGPFGTEIPISDREAAKYILEANDYRAPNNAFVRGWGRLQQSFNVLGQQLGLKSPQEFVARMMEIDRVYPDAPPEIQRGLQEITKSDGVLDALAAIARNPDAVLSVVGESLVTSSASLTTFIGGTMVAGPWAGAAAGGTVTFGTTFGIVISEEIKRSGVDPQDEAALMELMSNEEFWAKARERAALYSMPIAAFDALSMGLAGKIVASGVQKGAGTANLVARGGAEVGIQGALGASGEFGGQALEKEFGYRDKINTGEVVLEGVAEFPLGAVEVGVGTPFRVAESRNNQLQEQVRTAEEEAARQTAVDLLNPNSPAYGNVDPNQPAQADTDETAQADEEFDFRPSSQQEAQPPETPAETPIEQPVAAEQPVEAPVEPPVRSNNPRIMAQKDGDVWNIVGKENEGIQVVYSIADQKYLAVDRKNASVKIDEADSFGTLMDQLRDSLPAYIATRPKPAAAQINPDDITIPMSPSYTGSVEGPGIPDGLSVFQVRDGRHIVTDTRGVTLGEFGQPNIDRPAYIAIGKNRKELLANLKQVLPQYLADNPDTRAAQDVVDPGFNDDTPIYATDTPAQEAPVAAPVQPPVQEAPQENPQQTAAPVKNEEVFGKEFPVEVQTPDSTGVYNVMPVLVELSDLKQAQGALQPRDRDLKESTVEAKRRAAPGTFNAKRLLDSPTTGDGAPIIAKDGTILSGNGRVLTLQEVFNEEAKYQDSESYRQYMIALMDYGANPENFNQPVLVRMLQDDLTFEQLREFADKANSDAQARMSTTESAQRDAAKLTPQALDLYLGGDLTSNENRAFVNAFINQVLSPTEQNQFSRNGQLTKDGVQRMQAAILASAYSDTDALAMMLDSTDDNIKAISSAMMMAAPKIANLKARIRDGMVRREFDISNQITDAAKLISNLRAKKIKPVDYFNQQDAFSDTDPIVEALVRAFYNDELTRAGSQQLMRDVLEFYAEESLNRTPSDVALFEDKTSPEQVIRASRDRAREKRDGTNEGQGSIFTESGPEQGAQESGQQTQEPSSSRSSEDTGPSGTRTSWSVRENLTAELLPRLSLLKSQGINVRKSKYSDTPDVTIPIPNELADKYPSQLKTASGNKKPGMKVNIAVNGIEETGYTASAYSSAQVMADIQVADLLKNPEIDPRYQILQEAIEEINNLGDMNDDAGPTSEMDTSVETDAQLRGTAEFNAENVEIRENSEGSTRGSKQGRVLTKEKETLRQSVFLQAYRDAGLDPDKAVNMDPARQFKVLSDLVKDKFGFSYIQRGPTNNYDAVNSLLDAYRNLQWMTHALVIPPNAIGLEGSLGLALPGRAWGGYLAAYINKMGGDKAPTQSDVGEVQAPVVIMPKRSNSFAHEWGHALDYHILDKYGAEWNRGVTGRIRTNLKSGERVWQDSAPESVVEAMGDLINAMFFDQAEVAAKIMELEQKIAKSKVWEQKNGKESKTRIQQEEQLRKLIEGSTRSQINSSNYRKDAEDYAAAAQSDPDYWTRPTEMFARAFEAYVANIVENAGGSTEFIAMQDEAYKMTLDQVQDADIRLALTYPNEGDRNNIFLAMDRLMDALRTDMIQGEGAAAPGNYDIIDARVDFAAQVDPETTQEMKLSAIEAERKAIRAGRAQAKREENRPVRFSDRAPMQRTYIKFEDSVLNRLLWSKRGVLFSMADRYKNNGAATSVIEQIIARVATDPGGTKKRVAVQGGTFEEAVRLESRRFATRFKSILDKYGIDEYSDAQLQDLRNVLTADSSTQAIADSNMTQAAGELRTRILQPIYDYMRKNGYDINYLSEGAYMPRILDTVLALDDQKKFKYGPSGRKNPDGNRGAYPLYHNVIFGNEFGLENVGDRDQIVQLNNFAKRKGVSSMFDEELLTIHEEVSGLLYQIRKLEASLEETDDVDAVEAQIAEVQAQLDDLHGEYYEQLKDPYAELASDDWFTRIQQQQGMDPDAHAVQGSFAKKRKLPAQADQYMVDFYLDPVEALNQYIPAVVRKVEYEKRFGGSLVPKGSKLRDKNNPNSRRDFLDYLLEVEGTEAGIDAQDLNTIRMVVRKVTGTEQVTKDLVGKKLLDYIHVYGTMSLLPRAVLSSIAEPLTAGIQANSALAGAKTFFQVFDEALGMVSSSARERTLFFRQMANIMGVIDDPAVGEMVANRLGGTLAEDPKLNARLSRFFVRTKLQGLTNAQRRSSMRTGLQFFAEIAAEYQDAETSTQGKQRIAEIFGDFGITRQDIDQFTQWLATNRNGQFGMPNIDEMIEKNGDLSDMGRLLSIAVGRFTDQSIQDPKTVDRPMYAEHPLGRLVYGIQSFMRAFTRNVLFRSSNMIQREYQQRGFVSAASLASLQMLPAFMLLYGGHLFVSTLREALFNPDKLEREREDDNLVPYLLELGFSRSGFYGGADPFVQMIRSLKYQGDISNVAVGASLSFYMKAAQRILTAFTNNSPNTVSAEYQAIIGAYDLIATPLIVHGASMPGVGPILGTTFGVGSATLTSPAVKHAIARNIIKEIYGVEYYPGEGGRKKKDKSLGK